MLAQLLCIAAATLKVSVRKGLEVRVRTEEKKFSEGRYGLSKTKNVLLLLQNTGTDLKGEFCIGEDSMSGRLSLIRKIGGCL